MALARAPPLPRRIAHYDIFRDQEIGRGGFGTVCMGRNIQNNTDVVIKRVTRHNPRSQIGIDRELYALRSINHQHVTQLLHHERFDIHMYFVLELCNKDLQRFAQENQEFCNLKMRFAEEFALAVDCLHNNGIIHRDIKPENVLVKCSAGIWITKMSDLGLSRYVPEEMGSSAFSATGGVGTFAWMAPEVIPTDDQARYSKSADTYSLGLLNLSVADHGPGESLDALKGNMCRFVVKIY